MGNVRPAEPPPQPERFQELSMSALPRATEFLAQVQEDPGDPQPRRDLATLYRSQGFHAAGEFFAATADVLESKDARFSDRFPDTAWVAPLREDRTVAGDKRIAEESTELAMAGRPGEAVRSLEKAMEENGLSIDLLAAWSSGVLVAAALEPDVVSDEQVEAALRNFVTIVEETPVSPTGSLSPGEDYQLLSDLLMELGDPVSAYVAASLAVETFEPQTGLPEDLAEATRDRLARRLERTRQVVAAHVSGAPVPVRRTD